MAPRRFTRIWLILSFNINNQPINRRTGAPMRQWAGTLTDQRTNGPACQHASAPADRYVNRPVHQQAGAPTGWRIGASACSFPVYIDSSASQFGFEQSERQRNVIRLEPEILYRLNGAIAVMFGSVIFGGSSAGRIGVTHREKPNQLISPPGAEGRIGVAGWIGLAPGPPRSSKYRRNLHLNISTDMPCAASLGTRNKTVEWSGYCGCGSGPIQTRGWPAPAGFRGAPVCAHCG
jgi:hypothetical protein